VIYYNAFNQSLPYANLLLWHFNEARYVQFHLFFSSPLTEMGEYFLSGYTLRKYEKSTEFGALRQNMLSLIGCLFFHME